LKSFVVATALPEFLLNVLRGSVPLFPVFTPALHVSFADPVLEDTKTGIAAIKQCLGSAEFVLIEEVAPQGLARWSYYHKGFATISGVEGIEL
jgi:hypothetical protein